VPPRVLLLKRREMHIPKEPQFRVKPEDRAKDELWQKLAANYDAAEKLWNTIQNNLRNPWKL
jgi:hypothetical protein